MMMMMMMMNHPKLMVSCANFGGGGSKKKEKKMQNAFRIGCVRHNNDDYSRFNKGYDEANPLSLLCPWITSRPMSENKFMTPTKPTTCKILGPGMILLKNYISSLRDQADIVYMCEEWGLGPGGFYIPTDQNGQRLRRQMMSFGRNWDPVTKYKERCRSDGSEPPPLPSELISLTENALQYAQAHLQDELPSMCPDVCVVNFYSPSGRFDIHQDCDESSDSLQRGLPVVSISIGDWAEFVYGHESDENKLSGTYLTSGDVLIFGGKSRHIFHGVKHVFPFTTPPPLTQETTIRPGRLNLTLRQF